MKSRFYLETSALDNERIKSFVKEYFNYDYDGLFEYEKLFDTEGYYTVWSDYDEDMIKISRNFKDVLFTLTVQNMDTLKYMYLNGSVVKKFKGIMAFIEV